MNCRAIHFMNCHAIYRAHLCISARAVHLHPAHSHHLLLAWHISNSVLTKIQTFNHGPARKRLIIYSVESGMKGAHASSRGVFRLLRASKCGAQRCVIAVHVILACAKKYFLRALLFCRGVFSNYFFLRSSILSIVPQ